MCGLFGFFSLDCGTLTPKHVSAGEVALDSINHRGPDGSGYFVNENVFLGHRRLSILDLSDAGKQPMLTSDAKIAVTVNGEIYNYKEIRHEIGIENFDSDSDSEVILRGYPKFGLRGLMDRCDGMYAGVIYDARSKRIHFFRDRTGIKPLYYGFVGSNFVWASELKAIEVFASNMAESLAIDYTALLDFAAHRYVPAPKTIYQKIFKLRPAYTNSLNTLTGEEDQARYWELECSDLVPLRAKEDIKGLIEMSVKEQVVSDVPVGFFLSGGIDSSVISYAGAKCLSNISTFSMGFDDAAHDETHYANEVANLISSNHHKEVIASSDSGDLLAQMRSWYDEPFADTSALPTYMLCKMTRKNCTVALSGDGGDELFGGYKWYQRFQKYSRINKLMRLPKKANYLINYERPPNGIFEKLINKLAIATQSDLVSLYSSVMPNLLASELDFLRRELGIDASYDWLWSSRQHWRPELGKFKALQYLDFHTWLPDDILTKVDRVSMANSLEVRVPFLKKELVEYAFSLSERVLYENGELKGVLKTAYEGSLPDSILYREKKGFSIPTSTWKDSVLKEYGTFQYRYAREFSNIFPG